MPSLGGITEIIGVRAVIIDVRQYLADGREIERINERMAASELKLQAASQKASVSQTAAINAGKRNLADKQLLIKAINDEFLAEQKLNQARTTNVTGQRGPSGRFLPAGPDPAAIAQAEKELKFQQSLRSFISKAESQSSKEAIAFAGARTAALNVENTALAQKLKLQEEIAAAQRSRLNAATTGGALVATAAIGLTAGASITAAAKYQQELSKINVLTSATDEETKQLGESFKTLSTQIPVSVSDLAATAYKLLSSGIKDTGQALEITTNAAKAAVAGQADIKDIVSATIAVLNGYPKGAITASQANDILFAGVKEGSAEFNDFAGAIGKVIPIAAALNVPFDQLTAAMAVLTNGGLNAEEAMTGLRAILNDLAKDENSKQAQEALAQFGLTAADIRKKIKDEGLPQAMGELITLFKGNLAAIEPIIPNIRGMVAAYSAFNDGGKTTIGVLQSIDSAGGIVDQSFAKTKDNVANLAQIVKNQLNVALIEIGTAVLPEISRQLQGLIQWINANKQAITNFVSEGLQVLAKIISDLAAGFDALRGALAGIVGPANASKVAIAGIGLALAWALPGGPYLKGLALALTLLGQIQSTGVDTPIGHFGGRSRVDELKKEQEDLKNTLKEITNPSGPGGIKGFFNDLAGNLSDIFGTPGATNIGPTAAPQVNQEARRKVEEALAETSRQLANEEQKEADQKKLLDEATKPLSQITLPQLTANVDAVDQSFKKAQEDALKAAQALQKLAQDFQKSSEAARQVDSLTASLKLFGEITPEIAKAFNLTAVQAGNVQGIDAVAAATERATNKSFEYTKALATVAEALTQGGQAAVSAVAEIINGIASAALSASQSALNDLLSQPTREVADLGVPLARANQNTTNLQFRNQPQINALNQQLKAIDKQIAAQNRANQIANRAAQRQREAQQKAQQAAQKAQQQAAQAEADARKIANLQAQQAAERQLAALQKLIDATTKQQSDLQETFKTNNEALRKKFFEFTSQGNEAGALGVLSEQQRLTKSYHEQNNALTKQAQQQATQLKQAQEAEQERQRQVALADALFEAQNRQKESIDNSTDSFSDNTDAQDANTQALEDQKQKIQDQIDALQAPIDASKEQADSIQRAIDLYKTQADVLKAQGVQADHTLKTQEEQWQSAKKLITQIGIESDTVKKFSDQLGIDTFKSVNDANEQFRTLTGLLKVLNDPSGFIAKGFDPNAALAQIIKTALEDPAAKLTGAANNLKQAADSQLAAAAAVERAKVTTGQEQQMVAEMPPVSPEVLQNADNLITRLKNARIEANGLFFDYVKGASGLSTITRSISPIEIFKPTAMQDLQTIEGDVFRLGTDFGNAAVTVDNANTAAENLSTTISLIPAPDVGDAGKQTIDESTQSAQSLGNTLATQVRKPDIGDAGRQIIIDATGAARGLGSTLGGIANQIRGLGTSLGNLAAQAGRIGSTLGSMASIPRHATGGYFTKATLGIIGEAGPELVLPLNDVKRMAEILQQANVQPSSGLVGTIGGGDFNLGIQQAIKSGLQEQIASSGGGGFTAELGQKLSPWQQALNGIGRATGGTNGLFGSTGSEDDGSGAYGTGLTAELAQKLDPWIQALQSIGSSGGKLAWNAPRQIIAQLSPQLTAQLTAPQPAPAVFAPNITVTGETLDTMEATAIQAVRAAFQQARVTSGRQGGLITQGLGPGR